MSSNTDPTITSRIALITGVGRQVGIGAAVAAALARAGIHLFITYYRPFAKFPNFLSWPIVQYNIVNIISATL